MKIRPYFLVLISVLSFTISGLAQETPIGLWRDQLPYYQVISVTEAGNYIFAATPYAIFYLDRDNNSVQRMSKINGLSDIGITSIDYNKKTKTVVLTYANANIDLINNLMVTNISDIKRKQILGNKTINSIYCYDKYAYLACGFGIVVLDLEKEEIKDTYYIGPSGSPINVLSITSDNTDTIWAATELGIYKAYIKDPNLVNFAAWELDNQMDPTLKYNTITSMGSKVFVNKSRTTPNRDTVYIHSDGNWSPWFAGQSNTIHKLRSTEERLIITYNYNVNAFDQALEPAYSVWSYFPGSPYPLDAIEGNDNWLWIGDLYAGMVGYNISESYFQGYDLGGPLTANSFSMTALGDDLLIAPGGRDGSYVPTYNAGQIYKFDNTNWTNYSGWIISQMAGINDIVTVVVDPLDPNRFYAGSWGRGLLEFNGNDYVTRYGTWNSTLGHHSASDTADIRVGGTAFDNNGNLWVSTSHTNNCLSLKRGNDWKGFTITEVQEADLGQMIIDRYDQKWIVMRYGNMNPNSLLVFTDNGTPDNPTDDRAKKLNSSEGHGNIPGTIVFSIAQDQDGEVWIGTENGVAVFYSPENIFNGGNYDAQRILVEYGGYYQYLLENEIVTAIAVDGSNRKWIGTDRSGVFLFSADGTKEIYHFTVDNSPLFSNRITSLAINSNGDVFVGTDKGVISYRGSATEGTEKMDDVYAFPNPVKDGYSGIIGIKGLVTNAQVRITDISGALVHTTKAEGGQAIWDGTNLNGKRVKSGVYLVFASDEKGKEKVVTKIIIIN
ncbi:MAG: T9SS type A sorting domain-containing protein [Bacteroidales bacterium]|nr:T9SS type A sorting domain-containing protein [Bacteroidales bacterium]